MRKMMIFGSMVLSLLGLSPYEFAGNRGHRRTCDGPCLDSF